MSKASNKPVLQHCTLPQEVPLSNEFAKDHQMKVKHLAHAERMQEMGCDDSPGKGNYCSEETWPIQSDKRTAR